MFEPTIFYSTYLDDYHQYKAITLKKILDNLEQYEQEFFDEGLTPNGKEAYKKTIQADLRQTYFHCIETFFELFFCLNPKDEKFAGDKNLMISLTQSNWRKNFERIENIAANEEALEFLDDKIESSNFTVTIGHYIFYYGISLNQTVIENVLEKIKASLDAIKYGIRLIARDFIDREEYNSYKHGLRIIPALKQISVGDIVTRENMITWSLEDSMSFFTKTHSEDEVKIVTKIFDPERDYQMIHFCSNMISNMIYFRKLYFENTKPKGKIAFPFFGKEEIEKCNKGNVPLQNLVYHFKRHNE